MTRAPRLLVVSHPAVLPVNQLVYAELVERGWHVDVVVPARWRHEYGAIRPEPLPALVGHFHPLPVLMAGRPQRHMYRARVRGLLRRLGPDVIFLEQEPFSVAALQWGLAAHRAGVPFGVQADENLDRDLPLPVRASRSWVLRHAAFVAARSDRAGELVQRWGAVGDVRLVPHHVPEWSVPPRPPNPSFRVGYAGRLVEEKGLDVLTDAVRRLGGGVELVVAGDGPLRPWLENEDLGTAVLRLLTGLDHAAMGDAYASMDVLVLPSRTTEAWSEQFGRVLVEALWCGVPVVGSDSGEIPWVIETTGGGRVVPEGDAEALASVLAELRDDPGQRRVLAERGRAVVEQTFSVPAVAASLADVLTVVVGERRPRVALVAHGVHDRGGMERACAEFLRQCHEEFAFTVVAAELAPELRPLVQRWVRIRVPMRPIPVKFLAFFLEASLALRRLDVDLVHTVGAIVANRVDIVAVYHCHAGQKEAVGGLSIPSLPLPRRLNTAISRWIALVAERVIYRPAKAGVLVCSTESLSEEVQQHYPNLPTVVIANGVAGIDRMNSWPVSKREETRANLGVRGTTFALLFLGGDWHRKGLPVVLEGLAQLEDELDVALWVVGRGDRSEVESKAALLGISSRVTVIGPVDDVVPFFKAADAFVLASSYETFSIPCFEAAASGLPVIVTDVHGAGDLVRDGGAGIIVERTAASIAAAVRRLATGPKLRHEMGREGHRRASKFTWDRASAAMRMVYRELLQSTASR